MIQSSINMKLSSINRSTQVNEILSSCLVDAQSYTCQSNEKLIQHNEIFNQIETYKNVTFIDLDDIQLTNNQLLDNLIKESFLCSICRGLLVRTRLLSCGHQFCRECLYYWFKIRNTCPLCRKYVNRNISAINIDNFLDELIENGSNEALKYQRKQRKIEKASELLDYKLDINNSRDILHTVTETYVQTTAYVDSTQSNVMTDRTTYYSNMNE
ncbi:unnamed protein product [Schistosoma intercalatum]|nr:unnamed protein product [Schistosoma intercalatum]